MAHRETFEERDVLTPLTEDEARKLMSDLASEVRRCELLKEDKKQTDSELNKQIKGSQAEMTRLSAVIFSKQEKRRQNCRVVLDFENGKKYVFSPFAPDVVIAVEDLSDTDRQIRFPALAAGEPLAAQPVGFEAPVVMESKAVVCAECGASIPFDQANAREIRDADSGELIRTEFLCRNGVHQNVKPDTDKGDQQTGEDKQA